VNLFVLNHYFYSRNYTYVIQSRKVTTATCDMKGKIISDYMSYILNALTLHKI
jgi:hypothetical protein